MNETQIGTLVTGIAIMFFFGYGWSLETLRAKHSLYRLIKTGNRHSIIIGLHLFGFLAGLALVILCSIPLGDKLLSTDDKNKENKFPNYVMFLDTSVIKNEKNKVDKKALLTLNVFLERTKAKIVIISNDRFNRNSLINHKIEVLKLICANYGIKGSVVGSIPYTKGLYTRHQEIKLWYHITKIDFDNCVIVDKTTPNNEYIYRTAKVQGLLTQQSVTVISDILKTPYDPNIFNIRTQKYDEFFKSRK